MIFNSFEFLVFFPVVTLIYFLLPHQYRWLHLLIASCVFYMFFIPIYILILGFTIVVDYFAGIAIEQAEGRKRKMYLILSLIANIGVLAVFKYYNFFIGNINTAVGASLPLLQIILPIGLSFHTFQAMSYTIEVYRGKQKAERHFGIYALYVMFYPQLVAGPIERPQNILHQFYEKHYFDIHRVMEGLKIMLWGLFKKVVIADRLALYVDQVYNNPQNYQGFELIVATVFFAIQIYCDFSGYSDMAIGAAKVMGFKLMTNFRKPYFSTSVSEFWSRWHISLSTWFRDYVYIPLGGNRVVKSRLFFNLFITFLISGIWHGANWTFVVWGALNGIYLIFEVMFPKGLTRAFSFLGLGKADLLKEAVQRTWMLSLICFSWIFFRAADLSQAGYIIENSVKNLSGTLYIFQEKLAYFILIAGFFLIEYIQKNYTYSPYLQPATSSYRKAWNIALFSGFVWLIIVFGEYGSKEFIYFQF